MLPKEKLKVLFILPDFPLISETFIVNQLIFLLDSGHDVKLLAYNQATNPINSKVTEYQLLERTTFLNIPRSPIKKIVKFAQILFHNLNIKSIYSFNIFRFKHDVFKLSPLFKYVALKAVDDDYDIIHAHFGFASDLFFTGRFFGFFKTGKLITTFHGYDMMPNEVSYNRKRYKRLFRHNAIITVNNEYGKSLLKKIHPMINNIRLLPVGLDTQYYQPNKTLKPRNPITILFCGRLIALKGCLFLVEIANFLINDKNHKNLSFQLIGSGEEYDNIRRLISKYNLAEYVQLLGIRTQDEVIELMNQADIFILPGITENSGRAENQGLVIQEAQAMELPVIVSDAGGMKYGLLNGITGYIVKEQDLEGFCDKIELLASNPNLRSTMGKAGREYVKHNFDSRILGQQMENYYYQAISNF
ncbi:glycosyltransferase [Parapedobacter soli]|uniref:glycosyltransferase n=1 Tax=Parapedobacter soli TaxID=416955 RepID=UPI0021C8F5C5|nr:glycosyltransferase [Parapedobacter soli]